MRILREDLFDAVHELLLSVNETDTAARIAADNLCTADARGVVTHGTYLLTPIFQRAEVGQLELPTTPTLAMDGGAVCAVDGGNGLGPVAGMFAAQMALDRASKFGISLVLIKNTNNLGSLSYYTEWLARHGMVALMSCNAAPAMAPWGGSEAFIGTNPIAIAIYTGTDILFSADMATSVVARGKIRKASREGKSIPADWALDAEGLPTTDPAAALKGTLLPMAGPKGSSIALAVDIVSGLLAGAEHAPNLRSFHAPEGKTGVGASLIAIDISKFMELRQFAEEMDEYVQSIKAMKKARQTSEIYIPGEIEQQKEKISNDTGIVLDDKAVEVLNQLLISINSNNRLGASA